MRDISELKEIFDKMNESERFGTSFGLFPAWVLDYNLTTPEIVELMKFGGEIK